MTSTPFRSLQAQLAIRLSVLYVAATAVAVGVLIFQAYQAVGSLNDRDLSLRAADLSRYVAVDPNGTAHLDLLPALAASYKAAGDADIFAVRSSADKLLAASPSRFGEIVVKWPAATDEPSYFHLQDFGSDGREY